MSKYVAEWSGGFPCLCFGEWTLTKDEVDVTEFIPEEKRTSHMNTLKEYESWYFDENYEEQWEQYLDGQGVNVWIDDNIEWLTKLCGKENYEEMEKVYEAFKAEDFRPNSCGGCI